MEPSIKNNKERERVLKKIEKFEKSPWSFLIRKNRLTYLIIAFLIIFGIITIEELPRELNPEVEIPFAIVSSAYPGASPLNVEQQVTKEIETEISGLSGIKKINSTSSSGLSLITVEFEASEDIDKSIRALKDEVDKAKSDLPDDATDPIVSEISFADQAIFSVVLAGDEDVSELKQYAENLQKKLEGIPDVSEVKLIGGRNRVFKVDVDPQKISDKGLSVNAVLNVLRSNHLDFPAGEIEVDNLSYNVRVEGKIETIDELANIVIGSVENAPIYLADVAEINDSFVDESSRSRFAFGGQEAIDAVTLQVFKKTGGDITKVAETAREITENGRGVDYPKDLRAEVTLDQSNYIKESINSLLRNGLGTVLIVFALLFFFLGWKEALIAGLSIPFSFFIAFIAMASLGESLNFLSLFSLVLALGLLVDSAIVIVEGMYQKIAQLRLTGYQAAIATAEEYSSALLSGMLTTVAVFVPLMFVIGIIGQFIRTIPVVINVTLIAALFVALSIIPAVGALFLNPYKTSKFKTSKNGRGWFLKFCRFLKFKCTPKSRKDRLANKVFQYLADKYYDFLPKVISTAKIRRIILGSVWVLFAVSIGLVAIGFIKIEAFTSSDSEYFTVNIEMPEGTQLEETDTVVKKAEEVIKQEENIINYTSSIGSSSSSNIGGGSGGESNAFIYANLTKTGERDRTSTEIIENINQDLKKNITEAKFSFIQEESGPPSGSAVDLRVVGEDLNILENLAENIKSELNQIEGVVSSDTSINFSPGEIVFIPNKELLAQKNLSVSTIGLELNKGISRDRNLKIDANDGEEVKVDLGYDNEKFNSVESVESFLITAPNGQAYALSELGEVKLQAALSSIRREDEERVVNVTADVKGANVALVNEELQKRIDENIEIPEDYQIKFGGENEDTMEAFKDMFMKMIIGIILILFVLIIQFNSYKQVFIILSTIPLAMIGVFFGMGLAGLTMDFPAFIGLISLVGIVVNNAIILIDQINKELARGKLLIEATRKAGYTRMRPIILTSITTIMGLLPLSILEPVWRNMGFTIIFGLIFGTFLTLFIVPITMISFYHKTIK